MIEGIIDRAAREPGIDRVDLRRRNMISPEAMPFKTGLTYTYDCGEFEKTMDMALILADWQGFETAVFDPPALTFPNGCQVCEVEIDRDTGKLEIVRFVVVDDVGRVINPPTLKGQIHGGVARRAGHRRGDSLGDERRDRRARAAGNTPYRNAADT